MIKKNILFVDDNDNINKGIQRLLRPYREQWQLFFATSGSQALQLMSQNPIDLIVSDIMMPEMRGDDLLKQVKAIYPGTVRVILSGHTDEATLKIGLEVAHQYFSKPCSADILLEAITQIFKIRDCVSNPRIVAEVGDLNHLPSLPKIYHQLNSAITNEDSSINDIAGIIASDMVLSAKLLQLVNSPYFGFNRIVSSLSDAINLVGLKKLNNLVLSVHVKNAFPVMGSEMGRHMEYLWQDAGRVADLARLIAVSENLLGDQPDQAYLGGLLHNMGLLIFLSRNDDKLKLLMNQVKNTEIPVAELEATIFGFTRSEAAAYVLSLWKIPQPIIESILLQNRPNDSHYTVVSTLTAVHIAACLLKPSVMNGGDRLFDMSVDTTYLQRLGKLECLPGWQLLADKVMAQHAAK